MRKEQERITRERERLFKQQAILGGLRLFPFGYNPFSYLDCLSGYASYFTVDVRM
jgi:hypothetical protein